MSEPMSDSPLLLDVLRERFRNVLSAHGRVALDDIEDVLDGLMKALSS